ncbi:MAG TPA: CoA transferase, partial [Chryseolinea sp.]
KMPVALMDILAAHHLKEGILLAMLRKSKTGKGDFVEVSLLEAAVASLANQASNWLVAHVNPRKQGSAHPNIAPYGDIFKTSDGYEILLAVGNDRQFQSLCEVLRLAIPHYCSTNILRVKNRGLLNALLAEKIERLTLYQLTSDLSKANVPYGVIKDMQAVFNSPQVQALLLKSSDRVGVKTFVARTSGDQRSHFLPPPHLGEHSQEILSQSLAMDPESIKSLLTLGVIA